MVGRFRKALLYVWHCGDIYGFIYEADYYEDLCNFACSPQFRNLKTTFGTKTFYTLLHLKWPRYGKQPTKDNFDLILSYAYMAYIHIGLDVIWISAWRLNNLYTPITDLAYPSQLAPVYYIPQHSLT